MLDLAILLAFVAYSVGNGLRVRRLAGRDLDQYFLAGRSLAGWKAGMSMAATQFAADTPLLVTGLVATAGVFALWRLWIYGLAFLFLGFVLAPCWRRAGVLTDAELTERRYAAGPAAALRAIKALYFGVVFNCTVLAWVLFAAVRIAEPFVAFDEWLPAPVFGFVREVVSSVGVPLSPSVGAASEVWTRTANNLLAILLIVGFTTLYSTTGGLRSVVDTDVAQLGLMLVGTALFAFVVVRRAGGLEALPEQLDTALRGRAGGLTRSEMLAFDPTRARHATPALLAVVGVQWVAQLNADGTGYLAQRCMACRSDRDARIAAVVFTVIQVLVRSLLWLPLAVGLFLLFPPDPTLEGAAFVANREGTYVRGLAELLPVGVRGLLLTGMLAALASTVDTHLNWGASYVTNDLYRRFFCQSLRRRPPRPRELVWVARAANALILAIALAVMSRLGSIAEAWKTSLLFGAGLGGVLVLRWLWWRVTARAELAALVASLVLAPLALFAIVPDGPHAVSLFGLARAYAPDPAMSSEAYRLLFVALASVITAVVASLCGAPEPLERLQAFYERVRPPGFWGPVAVRAGEPADEARRRLARGLVAVAAGGLSIFCALGGLGSLLVGSPPPRGVPPGVGWPLFLLACSLVLFPVWWRLGVSQADRPGSSGRARTWRSSRSARGSR